MQARRAGLDEGEQLAAARAAAERFLAHRRCAAARAVALHAARRGELPTRPLFEALARAGIACLLPRARGDGRLEFAPVARWDDLRPGRYGVLEPPAADPARSLEEGDAVLLPGLAFDAAGHRLGQGKGYYDRTFPPGSAAPFLVGWAYEFQVVARLPHGDRDRRVDAVVTECAFRRCGGDA